MVSKLDTGTIERNEHDDATGAKIVEDVLEWAINHVPAANTVATISRTAVATKRHVCKSISASFVAGASAPTATTVTLSLRDGATGAGTVLWSLTMGIQAAAGSAQYVTLSDLNIVGSTNTAMTLEFSAAGGANTLESVSLSGYDKV